MNILQRGSDRKRWRWEKERGKSQWKAKSCIIKRFWCMWFGPRPYTFWLSLTPSRCWADAVGAALGVEGQTQCGLALKARLGSLLNQVFVFCIGLHVFRGGPAHKAATVPLNSFNSEISLWIKSVEFFFFIPPRHVCTLDSFITLDGSHAWWGDSPPRCWKQWAMHRRMGFRVKEPLVSSGAQPGTLIKGSWAAAVPHSPGHNVRAASSERVWATSCCWPGGEYPLKWLDYMRVKWGALMTNFDVFWFHIQAEQSFL